MRMLGHTIGLFKSSSSIVLELQCLKDKRSHGRGFTDVNSIYCNSEVIHPSLVIMDVASSFSFQSNTLKLC